MSENKLDNKSELCADYEETIKNYLNVLEILSHSTDNFLFLLEIAANKNWFFGDIDRVKNGENITRISISV